MVAVILSIIIVIVTIVVLVVVFYQQLGSLVHKLTSHSFLNFLGKT